MPHANRPMVFCANSIIKTVVTELRARPIADPASTSRVGPDAPPRETTSTRPLAASPPKNATNPRTGNGRAMPNAATATTAAYAPVSTARVSGAASGFSPAGRWW